MVNRQIVLIRHSYAVPESHKGDFSRGLSSRGKNVATRLAKRLTEERIPQKVILSPAKRVQETFEILNTLANLSEDKVSTHEILYQGNVSDYETVVQNLDDEISVIWLIAHNPTITFWCQELSNKSSLNMRPCMAAVLSSQSASWAEGISENWELRHLIDSNDL